MQLRGAGASCVAGVDLLTLKSPPAGPKASKMTVGRRERGFAPRRHAPPANVHGLLRQHHLPPPMLIAACFVVTAGLLWLGAEIAALAGARPRRTGLPATPAGPRPSASGA